MDSFEDKLISEIVREHFSTADVFKKYGISYCCGGEMDVQTACQRINLDKDSLQKELRMAARTMSISTKTDFNSWSLDFLTDFVTHLHHGYVKNIIPELQGGLLSFYDHHKKKFPETETTVFLLDQLAQSLMESSLEEEQSLFPYIKQMENAHTNKESYGKLLVSTLGKSLNYLQTTADRDLQLLKELQDQTNQYVVPSNACTKMHVLYQQLKELHHEIVQHKFLEANIILPKAIAIENDLLLH